MDIHLNMNRIYKCAYLVCIIITVFTIIFTQFDSTHFYGLNNENDEKITDRIFNRLYYTITTLSSANYGDIAPVTKITKLFTMILQLIIILGVMIIFI